MAETNAADLLDILRKTTVALVARSAPDLTARQLAVFLICSLDPEPHTVRGMAGRLTVAKPAVTRALDRLAELDLVRRKADPSDRRSVLVQTTVKGAAYLRDLRSIMGKAAAEDAQAVPKGKARAAAAG